MKIRGAHRNLRHAPLPSVFELFLLLSVQNERAAIDHRSMSFRAWDSAQRAKCVNLSKFTLLATYFRLATTYGSYALTT